MPASPTHDRRYLTQQIAPTVISSFALRLRAESASVRLRHFWSAQCKT